MPKKKMGTVSTMPPKTVSETIQEKVRQRVTTHIVADDPMFIPKYETDGAACCDLRAVLFHLKL